MERPWCASIGSTGQRVDCLAVFTTALTHQYVHHSRIASLCFCSSAL